VRGLSSIVSIVRRRTPAPPPAERPAPLPSGEVLQIEYAPHPDGDADAGEVVWTWVPFEDDPSKGKDRPVLVIGHLGAALAVLPLTSKDKTRFGDTVELGTGEWDKSHRVSYVRLDRVLGVVPSKVRREGATLERARFDHVVASLRSYHRTHPDG
jgi:PemK-like, MazF-like toxin of type II toxin-antitoxin system